jgi:putative intracellular protease/amidase
VSLPFLLVVGPRRVNVTEYAVTRASLERAGFSVKVASREPGAAGVEWANLLEAVLVVPALINVADILRRWTFRVPVDLALRDARAEACCGVAVVGGSGIKDLFGDADLEKLVRAVAAQGKPVGAICHGTGALARMEGLLKDRDVTGVFQVWGEIRRSGARLDGGYPRHPIALVKHDGIFVTGRDPFSAPAFGRALAEAARLYEGEPTRRRETA